ncbi:hypothetical protein QWY84_12975 [Aquisalimonas lutea]|uniref:hypothetical protein n=1 Tax=Aquisalimonas lutea TaxID=1327750 RepID=UPI0025B43886|nr:hypothetical protein [Aquisalimonas lutea]MDN3518528.1 hypothetical protein [Aquisalimonas lutea]
MAHTKQSQGTATPIDPSSWAQPWTMAMKGAEESVQRMQEVTAELQDAVRQTSQGQVDDWMKTGDRIAKTVARAAETREPATLLTVQPELVSCFLDAAQASNKRWLDFVDQVRSCSSRIFVANGTMATASSSQPVPGKGDGAGRPDADEAAPE